MTGPTRAAISIGFSAAATVSMPQSADALSGPTFLTAAAFGAH